MQHHDTWLRYVIKAPTIPLPIIFPAGTAASLAGHRCTNRDQPTVVRAAQGRGGAAARGGACAARPATGPGADAEDSRRPAGRCAAGEQTAGAARRRRRTSPVRRGAVRCCAATAKTAKQREAARSSAKRGVRGRHAAAGFVWRGGAALAARAGGLWFTQREYNKARFRGWLRPFTQARGSQCGGGLSRVCGIKICAQDRSVTAARS